MNQVDFTSWDYKLEIATSAVTWGENVSNVFSYVVTHTKMLVGALFFYVVDVAYR